MTTLVPAAAVSFMWWASLPASSVLFGIGIVVATVLPGP